jgi:hypothetical protein
VKSEQGRQANRSGRAAEDMLARTLISRGCQVAQQVVMGKTIYGTDLRVDILVSNLAAFPGGLVIESKWQDCGGSVDEKFPFLVENIKTCLPVPAIVVLDGAGYRDGARAWLRSKVDGDRLVAVFDVAEFMSWLFRLRDDLIITPSNRELSL